MELLDLTEKEFIKSISTWQNYVRCKVITDQWLGCIASACRPLTVSAKM